MLPATIEPDALRALEVSASPPSWGAGLAALLAVAVLAWAVRGADWARVADGSDDAPDAPGAGAHRFWGLATAVAVLWHADPAGDRCVDVPIVDRHSPHCQRSAIGLQRRLRRRAGDSA